MLELREAVNVDDFKQREELLLRLRTLRGEVRLSLNSIEHWNRTHPDERQLSTEFEVAMLAYLDGKGPMPTLPASEAADV